MCVCVRECVCVCVCVTTVTGARFLNGHFILKFYNVIKVTCIIYYSKCADRFIHVHSLIIELDILQTSQKQTKRNIYWELVIT